MKIGVDARCLSKRPDGVASYLINALSFLSERYKDWEICLFTHKPLDERVTARFKNRTNIHPQISRLKIMPENGFLWFVFKLPCMLRKYKPDIYWAPAVVAPLFLPCQTKLLITVHDMVYHLYRNTMSIKNKIANYFFHDYAIRRADYIWTVSHYTEELVKQYYPKRKCKTLFVGSSISSELYKRVEIPVEEETELRKKLDITGNFLLFVGTVEPRKNLTFLLGLMPRLTRLNLSLVVVGAKGWGNNEKIKAILEQPDFPVDKVKLLGYVSDAELVRLYNLASCFVSASLNEGFGLPQLEAIACGCPVVTACNSAMKEVVEGAGFLVDTWDEATWIEKIKEAIRSKERIAPLCKVKTEAYKWEDIIENLKSYLDE